MLLPVGRKGLSASCCAPVNANIRRLDQATLAVARQGPRPQRCSR